MNLTARLESINNHCDTVTSRGIVTRWWDVVVVCAGDREIARLNVLSSEDPETYDAALTAAGYAGAEWSNRASR